MFCPKCGLLLERNQDGSLFCRQGDMELSRKMEAALTQRYAEGALAQSSEPLYNPHIHRGIHWHCPECGDALNFNLECERGHGHLRDLVFPLVELHPHRIMI